MTYDLSGDLSKFGLPDIIQLLTTGQKSGELVVRSGNGRGGASLFFKEGNLVHAVCGENDGVKAFENLIRWEAGSFEFIPNREPRKRTMNTAAHVVLLQTFARLDEMHQIQQNLPPDDINLFIVAHIGNAPEITVEDWKVLALVNGRRSIARICQKFGDELKAKTTLLKLYKEGLISPEPPETDWRRLVPILRSSVEEKGERSLPPRIRTNLLIKTIDGKSHFEDIRRKLDISENDLLEDIKLLYEFRWIKFNETDHEKFQTLLPDI
ncbi:DUF4388 domain-containing protein [candidate division WOR-3 bacterium]|uniref:DUF4388 domain-containing protein n=1 Tax=candidate division WOR-3 bacterium TaxID=2052148 RepID=A0A9D5KB90_UNCW3|nr:DUF4388 domain-containing protein [candidate division WOR-3 bacterium]MBD3365574.1 DUF4388 domain-containing protein [candidate division WOR-3 bacterium]